MCHSELTGNVQKQMADGIEDSGVMICCMTKNYMNKAVGRGPRGLDDNVHYEFNIASTKMGADRMIPVVFEEEVRDW